MLPVGFVDRSRDSYAPDYRTEPKYRAMNDVSRGVHDIYDADAMHGMPLAVQVVGGRFEEEKVLTGMRVIERALRDAGKGYVPRNM